jgi:hypothetical protein
MMRSSNASEHVAQRSTGIKVINSSNPGLERPMTPAKTRDPLMKRLFRWLVPEQRVASRHPMPPLIAYLGPIRSAKEYRVGDVSVAGFYMITEERWIPGAGFPVTLERRDPEAEGRMLTLYSTVVRVGENGVGFTFLQRAPQEHSHLQIMRTGTQVDLTRVAQFLKGLPLSQPETLERAS